ncbi:MAG: hypothetical protein K2X77_28180 [Candidatus Obscuribacterales bacterium]|jgi:hypothetical protein|nr:hypothetical protein [Candidatus Obscuribacterales bacterium]
MQGKGAGAVNRVELECQVLCAALRQSWVRRDKVGAFTSIRELSHLFPDLLPPPEERVSTNKANYYEVLGVRPQSGLNSIVVGYLRTVRKFLKQYNPKDHRQFYNTMLNAGFVLRKPRLRLSHDLVVARRWLYDSQAQDEEILTEEQVEAAAAQVQAPPSPAQPETPAQPALQEASPQEAPPIHPAAVSEAETGAAAASKQEAALDPLAAAEAAWASNQAAQAKYDTPHTATPPAEKPITAEWHQPKTDVPYVDYSRFQNQQSAAANSQESAPPAVPTPSSPPAAQVEPEKVAPPPAVAPEPAVPEFKFDEAQLRKPEVEVELPSIIRLMEASHLIGKLEVQAIKAQMVLAPNIPAEQLVINAGYATRTELASLKLAQDLLSSGKITMAQFQVAMYDERTSGLRMAESLQVRGWLATEVKNSIEELKQQ